MIQLFDGCFSHFIPPWVCLLAARARMIFGWETAQVVRKSVRQDKRSLQGRLSLCLHILFSTSFGGSEIFASNSLIFLSRFGGTYG